MNNTANELKAVRSELEIISSRMAAIPFESPINYSEFYNLRDRRSSLRDAQRSLLNRADAPFSIYGLDVAIAEALNAA